jgi:AraC-like DNA-binding protein
MIISSIGVINSVFVIFYLIKTSRGDKKLNLLLALLVLSFTIRIGKSVVFYYSDHLSHVIINVGFSGFLLVGPSLFLYFQALWKKNFRIISLEYLHFLPSALVLLSSWLIPYDPGNRFWQAGYLFIILHIFTYIVLTSFLFFKSYPEQSDFKNSGLLRIRWSFSLLASVFLIWIAYFIHFPLRLGSYINGAIIYSIIIYFVIFQWIRLNRGKHHVHARKKGIILSLDEESIGRIIKQIQERIIKEELYKIPNLNLRTLARHFSIQPYRLSKIINDYFHQSFPDFINQYRIKEATKLLVDKRYDYLTIAGIASEVGFNSISVFNSTFKKLMNQTPSQYKRKHQIEVKERY